MKRLRTTSDSPRLSKKEEGVQYFNLAKAYLRTANVVLQDLDSQNPGDAYRALPVRFLYSHAAELLLKAYLRMQGKRRSVHALEVLLNECVTAGLDERFVASFRTILPLLQVGHNESQFRYFEKSIGTPDPHWMQSAIEEVASAVGTEVHKHHDAVEQRAKAGNTGLFPQPTKMIISVSGKR